MESISYGIAQQKLLCNQETIDGNAISLHRRKKPHRSTYPSPRLTCVSVYLLVYGTSNFVAVATGAVSQL